MVSFAVQKLVSLIRSYWFIFAFISVAFKDWPKKTLVPFMLENVLPVFSARDSVELYSFARTQPVVPLPFVEKSILFFFRLIYGGVICHILSFYWSIVDLQCCVTFCCTLKWISSMYTYIHSFLFVLVTPHGMWDLSSPTRVQTCGPSSRSAES